MGTPSTAQLQNEKNFLLESINPAASDLLNQMELVPLPIGKILQRPGEAIRHAYFPTTCIVSLISGSGNDATEAAIIGNEGVVGITDIISDGMTQLQAVVQSTGFAYRIRASVVREQFRSNAMLQSQFLKYIRALMAQMAQIVACNRHHTLDQQLCRWLLQSIDRLPTNELAVTQEFISNMLGVRREGVTTAAGKLQRAGLINYRRGHISIVDRAGLEQQSCECYSVIRQEYDRLLPLSARDKTSVAHTALDWNEKSLGNATGILRDTALHGTQNDGGKNGTYFKAISI